MATLSGSFTGPAVTDAVPYVAGDAITFSIHGEWPKAIINAEVTQDAGVTWAAVLTDIGIHGASEASFTGFGYPPTREPGDVTFHPPGAGLFRLRCVEFRSGWCNWKIDWIGGPSVPYVPPPVAVTPSVKPVVYTASGAIDPSITRAVIDSPSDCNMTLGKGNTDGHVIWIQRVGMGAVVVAANIDGRADAKFTADIPGAYEPLDLTWSVFGGTWLSS